MGNRIRQERVVFKNPETGKLGLSLEELVILAELGVSSRTLRSWEHGQSDPTATMLGKLADFFGCSVDWLVGRGDRRTPAA